MNRYGLIGEKLGHSFSATYFNDRFAKEGLTDYVYDLYELESIDAFTELISSTPELKGLNVTTPFKEQIIPFLDDVDDLAKRIGAVNTIKIENGKTKGYNTDAYGFKASIRPFLENKHERALILGTGGAAKAVASVLSEIGIQVFFASRNPVIQNAFAYKDLNEAIVNACLMIVNCTPVGMHPNEDSAPALTTSILGKNHFVVDLIYNPEETLLLREAKKQGAMVLNGADMLRFQAEEAWRIWQS
jgi:shikimate dehydrogenase